MKFIINKSALESIVMNTSSYLEKKDLSAITSHISIEVKDKLYIKATDYEIGLTYELIDIEIIQEGNATANGKKLLDIIKSLKEGKITLKTEKNYLLIEQNNSKYKLPMYNFEDFPEFPTINNMNKFEIDTILLTNALKKILPIIPINNPKYEINGALIEIKNKNLNIVATDTNRIGIINFKIDSEKDFSLIIPKKAINEIQKLFFDKIEILYNENILIAKSSKFTFFTKLINGKYPNYEKALKNDFDFKLNLKRDKILDGIKSISFLSEKMDINFSNNEIEFEGITDDNSEAKTIIEHENKINENFKIRVKNKAILDFLNNIESDEFIFEFKNEDVAFLVSSNNFKTAIMPIRN